MATDEKPSRNEDEYFKKLDQELLRKQRADHEASDKEVSRSEYFMRCPKDGGTLSERELDGVKVDVCSSCNGIWLDAGELDTLRSGDQSGLSRFFGKVLGR